MFEAETVEGANEVLGCNKLSSLIRRGREELRESGREDLWGRRGQSTEEQVC